MFREVGSATVASDAKSKNGFAVVVPTVCALLVSSSSNGLNAVTVLVCVALAACGGILAGGGEKARFCSSWCGTATFTGAGGGMYAALGARPAVMSRMSSSPSLSLIAATDAAHKYPRMCALWARLAEQSEEEHSDLKELDGYTVSRGTSVNVVGE